MAYAPHTPDDVRAMLERIGAASVDELFSSIPESVRLRRPLDLPAGISEAALRREMGRMARADRAVDEAVCFAGGGTYDHDIPAVVPYLALRSEFATAYTPYQAEVSQGTLQVIYEFQTWICRLTGLQVSNASLYDGATALVEGVLLALAHTRRRKVLVPALLTAARRRVLDTYIQAHDVELVEIPPTAEGRLDLDALRAQLDEETACVVVAQPNALGVLEDTSAVASLLGGSRALLLAAVNPTTLPLISPPGEWGAAIAVGEGQPLGVPMSFGGPRLGFMAVTDELKRRIPGRLVGETVDADGRRAFTLTLQTREQHIRREKATSNICTNQGLLATMATIYLATLGRQGLMDVATACYDKAHHLARGLSAVDGLDLPFAAPFFHEFVVRWPRPAREVLAAFRREGILAGVALQDVVEGADPRDLLVAVTEVRTAEEIEAYRRTAIDVLAEVRAKEGK